MKRGEVWWVELPDRKRRPYVIMSRDSSVSMLTSVVAVACTRTRRNLPTEVPLDGSDGLPEPCVASFDNVETLPKWAFVGRITHLSTQQSVELCIALRLALDC